MAIKCHSGFQHYHMFHNSHCHGGGNNYGSIFNITNNCGSNCGGGFWGGLGAGLGYGLGGMFSGLFGGLMGGFGNMFGGFGMNMFGGFGNMFGGFGLGLGGWGFGGGLSGLFGGGNDRSRRSDDDYDRYSSRRRETDKDYTAINDFVQRGDAILDRPSSTTVDTEIDTLIAELGKYTHKDDVNKSDNIRQIELLIERLKKHKTRATTPTPDPANDEATGKIGETKISDLTADGVDGITNEEYSKLNDADKNALKVKVEELAKANPVNAAEWANSTTLPDDLRAAIKASFYTPGNTNYDGTAKITGADITRAHDTYSDLEKADDKPRDVKPQTNDTAITVIQADGSHPTEITIKDSKLAGNDKTITYIYQRTEHGEYIYKSDRASGQEYVLQKTSEGKYELVQYRYHTGWSKEDAAGTP